MSDLTEQQQDEMAEGERSRLLAALREARKAAGLTQEDVARSIGVSRGQIANGESGKTGLGLSMETFIAYAATLGLRVNLEADMRTKKRGCVFCEIVQQQSFANVVRSWPDALAFVPLNPVTEGHVLVVPREHVADVTEDPEVSALTMRRAAELAAPDCNIITSAGAAATQTIRHLHLHVVPRRECDGLRLPWSDQHAARGGDDRG